MGLAGGRGALDVDEVGGAEGAKGGNVGGTGGGGPGADGGEQRGKGVVRDAVEHARVPAMPPPRRTPTPSSPPAIARGATARSAASPRVNASLANTSARRASLKPSSSPAPNGDSKDTLKQDADHKEQLLVQLQDKETTITTLTTENDNLTSALNAAESRLNELYAEQSRSEVELAQRIDIIDKLRAQMREFEREKRDLQRRYNEQTTSFEAERQAFYDNEQHLKSRIQSLTQARKQLEPETVPSPQVSEKETEAEADARAPQPDGRDAEEIDKPPPESKISEKTVIQDFNDPESEPAEMTALRLELSTLSTSYASLQSTLVLLQTQLVDLKRVNRELQEENESYMILLREKTLSGQFDVMRQVGGTTMSESEDDEDDERDSIDIRSSRSGRSTLDKVDELPESLEFELEQSLDLNGPPNSRSGGRHSRNRSTSIRGETLADLPITGPGLDLAAELGRAENKDMLSNNNLDDRDRPGPLGKKRSKKGYDGRKVSASSEADATNDIDALRTEVKSLKDANKALSLYASKIIDRIIAQEGYEHVLAADYEAESNTPLTAAPQSSPFKPTITISNPSSRARPQSISVGRSSSNPGPSAGLTPPTPNTAQSVKGQRRSLSFDWKGFSFFSGAAEKKPELNLRPLTLTPDAMTVTGSARKVETFEDEEDRKERERLNATMKLMGIRPQTPVAIERTQSASSSTPSTSNRRFSMFGKSMTASTTMSSTTGDNSRVGLGIGISSDLTKEALVQAEAQSSITALDAQERNLSVELARGSGGGFTEIAPRSIGRRSRRSAGGSGSGSTVWSAGMSANDE
ncbi:hypothetical protein AX15_006675 [Amanita polypyramis BW_CC]|nr:hypothetical protein AX15_006675 [Amanita polypyramis BW_CC]